MNCISNKYIKTSKVNITTLNKYGKTILDDIYFTAPFKVSQPFYKEDNSIKVIIMSSSAGIMAGDIQEYNITVEDNTNIEVTSQSYEKIHKMEEGDAHRKCNIIVGSNSLLKYKPLPTIPFKDSAFNSNMSITLKDKSSRLILIDIISCGRVAFGESFEYKYYKSYTEVKCCDKLVYIDNTFYDSSIIDLSNFGMFEGYSHLANMLICNFGDPIEKLDLVRVIIENNEDINGGATLTQSKDISIKVFGYSAQKLISVSEEISEIFENIY
ncbi:urease accessory protein UreH [[Clostridium] sordellii]|uniref:Urease accessory protein UreD n=1 Tax=Paraclostridium sordellii TaxID=1505 RepID=A0ABP1XRG1_PARSO|nr:urease accessory protein UreD [Paeniclostridium sordellii]CEJ73737.1 ureD urease accessory family protein [[Clostridium] sordellii] [Paeniclostridium sordellii]CEN69285.1 urease accessory protein UreH [[Clostridium] sordellii] [Paeniclostridium sordellii]CEN72553.1 urease accessory protein UreH [[Clostridium] sordellii] [Paeniclostridium sordellii]CEO24123.1 urease accessory protein UreH [[Clostridium] sordellii] [Paeniclostridium sordellii]CEP75854.1 urease accessory protein UreH [[Clostri